MFTVVDVCGDDIWLRHAECVVFDQRNCALQFSLVSIDTLAFWASGREPQRVKLLPGVLVGQRPGDRFHS